jgi:hypothetical protein
LTGNVAENGVIAVIAVIDSYEYVWSGCVVVFVAGLDCAVFLLVMSPELRGGGPYTKTEVAGTSSSSDILSLLTPTLAIVSE